MKRLAEFTRSLDNRAGLMTLRELVESIPKVTNGLEKRGICLAPARIIVSPRAKPVPPSSVTRRVRRHKVAPKRVQVPAELSTFEMGDGHLLSDWRSSGSEAGTALGQRCRTSAVHLGEKSR